jgi:hypothetical protein
MTQQKEVVDLKKELGPGVNAPAQPRPRKFRFRKLHAPVQPVVLADGKKVQFKVVKLNTGGYSRYGTLETEDETLAKALRAVSKTGRQFVREV